MGRHRVLMNSSMSKEKVRVIPRGFSWPANQKYVQHVWAEISQIPRLMWHLDQHLNSVCATL